MSSVCSSDSLDSADTPCFLWWAVGVELTGCSLLAMACCSWMLLNKSSRICQEAVWCNTLWKVKKTLYLVYSVRFNFLLKSGFNAAKFIIEMTFPSLSRLHNITGNSLCNLIKWFIFTFLCISTLPLTCELHAVTWVLHSLCHWVDSSFRVVLFGPRCISSPAR